MGSEVLLGLQSSKAADVCVSLLQIQDRKPSYRSVACQSATMLNCTAVDVGHTDRLLFHLSLFLDL